MDEFDRFLEAELRQMLNPTVVVRPPARGGLKESRKPILTVVAPAIELELAAQAIPIAEPLPKVTLAIVPANTL